MTEPYQVIVEAVTTERYRMLVLAENRSEAGEAAAAERGEIVGERRIVQRDATVLRVALDDMGQLPRIALVSRGAAAVLAERVNLELDRLACPPLLRDLRGGGPGHIYDVVELGVDGAARGAPAAHAWARDPADVRIYETDGDSWDAAERPWDPLTTAVMLELQMITEA